jgi:hypothetical protein
VDAPRADAIQRALDEAGASAVVIVPAARYEVDAPIVVRHDDVLLIGSGAGSLELGSRADGSATVLARSVDHGTSVRPMIRAVGARRVQIAAIRFEGVEGEASKSKDVGILLEDAEDFRVDHTYFGHMGFAGVRTNGTSRGVVDHCTFYAEFKPAIGTEGYGVAVYGTDALAGIPLGEQTAERAPRATVVEDSRFSLCRHAIASNKGGRYVFSHNYVTRGVIAHAIDAHGAEYGSAVGGEWMDVHDNVIEQPEHSRPYYDGYAIRVRGGKAAIWHNALRGYHTGVELTELTNQPCGPVYVWDNRMEPPGEAMVHARPAPKGEPPESVFGAPPGYLPFAYPHPLAASTCDGKPMTRVGAAQICPAD